MARAERHPRQPGWEPRYIAALERHMAAPFEWGVSDCLSVVADVAEAICGVNPLPAKRRRYRTAPGAARQLRRLGYQTIEEALGGTFEQIPVLKARRGDCGVLEQMVDGETQQAAVIVMGAIAVGKGPDGPMHVPLGRLKAAFAIGAF